MATIKLKSNGKVITKNEKVSCECCAPAGCCMYPAAELASGLFNENDLPDNITFNGRPPLPQLSIARSGKNYLTTYNGVSVGLTFDTILNPPGLWLTKDLTGGNTGLSCLFSEQTIGLVDDQFLDTYYLSATNNVNSNQSFSNVAVNRQSLCFWSGSSGDRTFGLIYSERVQFNIKDVWFVRFSGIDGTSASGGRINTPVGGYNDRFNFSNITISE
jgi:hypothetical protein